jgi:hypothetical protein
MHKHPSDRRDCGRPDYLIYGREAVYGRDFGARLSKMGITSVRTPFRAPRANAIAEPLVRSIRQECLDHVIVINERHLHAVLVEFADYYNLDRPHRSLGLQSPLHRPLVQAGPVTRRPVLGGYITSVAVLVELGWNFAPLQLRWPPRSRRRDPRRPQDPVDAHRGQMDALLSSQHLGQVLLVEARVC